MSNVEDTGERRRYVDKCTTDKALELVCSLAMENALSKNDPATVEYVERAIIKLRELKAVATGVYPVLDPENLPAMLRRQAD